MPIISFPKLDTKTLILLFFILTSCASYLINLLVIDGIQPFQSKYFDHICQFLIAIPIFLYKKSKKKKDLNKQKLIIKTTKNSSKFSKRDIFLFIVVGFIDLSANLSFILFDKEFRKTFYFYNRETIQMILVIIFGKHFIHSLTHRHKLISQFIFTVLTTILDIQFIIKKKNIFDFNYINIISYFIAILFDAISITYKYYLFEVKYFSVEKLMLSFGFFNVLFMNILIISQVIYGKLFCFNENQCFNIINFKYDDLKAWRSISASFLINSSSYVFYYKTLKCYTPNDILLTVSIYIFFANVKDFYMEEMNTLFLIIFSFIFLLILISYLVYLEIMELNFCYLNKNTRRSILRREGEEDIVLEDEGNENENINQLNRNETNVELDGYIIDNINLE